jgi:hypothetical protein
MGASEVSATTVTPASRGPPIYKYLSFLLQHDLEEYYMKMFKRTHVAVAPMYESEPTTPHVYNAARDSMAGLRKKSGLSVAAWQALKAYGGMSLKRVL